MLIGPLKNTLPVHTGRVFPSKPRRFKVEAEASLRSAYQKDSSYNRLQIEILAPGSLAALSKPPDDRNHHQGQTNLHQDLFSIQRVDA